MTEHSTEDPRRSETDDDDSFLSRWARRKSEAKRSSETSEDEVPDNSVRTSQSVDQQRESPDSTSQAQLEADDRPNGEPEPEALPPGDEDMPPLDSIDQGGSVSDFFSPRVSKALRQAALNRLFKQSSLPVFDDLDDYAGDYTDLSPLGDVVTNEMRHRIELAKQRLLDKEKARLAESEREEAHEDREQEATESGDRSDEQNAIESEDNAQSESSTGEARGEQDENKQTSIEPTESESEADSLGSEIENDRIETPQEFQNDRNTE